MDAIKNQIEALITDAITRYSADPTKDGLEAIATLTDIHDYWQGLEYEEQERKRQEEVVEPTPTNGARFGAAARQKVRGN